MPVDVGGIKIGGENVIREYLVLYASAINIHSHGNNSSTIQDLSGLNNDSTSKNDVTWRNYYWDFDVNFDDTSKIDFPNCGMSGNVTAQDWTWEIWIYPHSLTGLGSVVMQGNKNNSFGFDKGSSSNTLRFGISPDNTPYTVSTTLIVNNWYHCVGTYDGDSAAGQARLYVNGVLKGTSSAASGTYSESGNIRVGAVRNISQTTGATRYDGGFSVFRIYNKTLSHDEVLYNFNAERGAFGI